jgi:hypothetical protein
MPADIVSQTAGSFEFPTGHLRKSQAMMPFRQDGSMAGLLPGRAPPHLASGIMAGSQERAGSPTATSLSLAPMLTSSTARRQLGSQAQQLHLPAAQARANEQRQLPFHAPRPAVAPRGASTDQRGGLFFGVAGSVSQRSSCASHGSGAQAAGNCDPRLPMLLPRPPVRPMAAVTGEAAAAGTTASAARTGSRGEALRAANASLLLAIGAKRQRETPTMAAPAGPAGAKKPSLVMSLFEGVPPA